MKKQTYQPLQTVRVLGKLRAVGSLFCNGLSNRYQTKTPKILSQILTPHEKTKLQSYINQLNFKTSQYWPCLFAFWCGYLCAPCTLGLSLCLPNICVGQAQIVLQQEIKKINHDILSSKKIEMRLVKGCLDSYLLIEEIDFSQFDGVDIEF